MNILFSFIAGLIFGLGLIVAGMANPAKVLNFLDLAGTWDPSLAFVMAGAVAVGAIAFALAKSKATSLLGFPMRLPSARHIDRRLVGGSTLFGIGWGLAGICPGPAVVLLGSYKWQGLIFVGAMVIGMMLFEWQDRRLRRHLDSSLNGSALPGKN